MAELLQRIRTQVDDFIKSLDKRKKMWLAGGALFVVIVVIAIGFLTRPNWVTLISDVEYDDMSSIVAKLNEEQIAHKEPNGERAVYVDIDDLTKAKMAIAVGLNLTQPDYSWTDVFANTSFSMTSEMKEQQIMQAKASTLGSTLKNYINGVSNAKVELYIAQDSNFITDGDAKSTAAVILALERGVVLTPQEVEGIVGIIASSVKNLDRENIEIIDQTGVSLVNHIQETDAFLASSQREQENNVEKHMEERLKDFLGTIYGRQRVVVQVAVELDFDKRITESVVFSTPVEGQVDGIIRSMVELSETASGSDTASGIPGTESNIESTDYPSGSDSGNDYQKLQKTVNYEMNKVEEIVEKAQGTVTSVTISVVIDPTDLENGILTEEDKSVLVDLIINASGMETRKVFVDSKVFADKDAGIIKFSSDDDQIAPGIPIWLVGLIIGILAIAVVVFVLLSRSKANKQKAEEIEAVKAEEEARHQDALEEIQTDVEDTSSPKYQIEKFIEAKPEAVASLLRNWMNEN